MVVGDAISRHEVAGIGTRTIAVLFAFALGAALLRAQTVPVKTLDPLWRSGARSQLEQRVLEGDPELAL